MLFMKPEEQENIINIAKQHQLDTGDIWDDSRGSRIERTGGILGIFGKSYTVYMYKNGAGGNILVKLKRSDLSLIKIITWSR